MITLLWDLDGTLIDSMPVISDCLHKTAQRYGQEPLSDDQVRQLIGPELGDILRLMIGDEPDFDVAEAKKVYRSFYQQAMLSSPVFEGLAQALSHFRELGMTNLVATAKYQSYAEQIIAAGDLSSLISGVYGSEADGRLGNKVHLLEHILREEHLSPAQTIMIGDTRFDMEAARAHDLTAVGVQWGYGHRDDLKTAGAHYIVDEPADLISIVKDALTCGC